jgi:nucleoside-diphosphate-sugar epimerase
LKVLVTGAAGFIGSHLTRALLHAGHSVRAIDNLSTGRLERIEDLLADVDWLEADICDPAMSARAVNGVEVVLHEAAIPSVARSLADPVASDVANVLGTVTLLQACREAGVRRLVYAASSSAYGATPALPKVETMCPTPLSPYAVSKLAGEQYCRVFAGLGYVETVSLRYFNVFGPGQDPRSQYAAVIPRFTCALLKREPVLLYGNGMQSRDFTYVQNVVQANLLAMSAGEVAGEVINIGCGQRYDLNTLIDSLAGILGVEPAVECLPARSGDVQHSLADISKARRMLGYDPDVDFHEGLRRTVRWFQEHPGD